MAKENEGKGETTTTPKAVSDDKFVSHKNIYRALSWFQGELTPIEKTAQVKFKTKAGDTVDFKYAPLGDIMEKIYPLLAKHGLSVRHEITDKTVECILMHETTEDKVEVIKETTVKQSAVADGEEQTNTVKESDIVIYGEIRSGKLAVDLTKPDMKEVGGQITYGRRYTLGLVLGLATEEDKDTELMDMARKNVEDFAFTQAKKTIEAIDTKKDGQKLAEQVTFLEKELALAEAMEAGTGTKAPSLGLKAEQLRSLITIAKAKVGNTNNAPKEETA